MAIETSQSSPGLQPGSSQTFYGPAIMLFVLIGLLFGILFRQINKKYGLPFTPLLIILGIILGNIHPYIGQWGRGAFTIEAIHPHSGMSIFVPTLVFTGALGANFYMFKKQLGNILLLSIPGVVIGSLLMGFVFKVILGYDDSEMNWMQAITLGCSLTSTDPVAVVALLKQFNTTGKFSTLVDGESLVSSAFSMILYYLLLDVTNGQIINTFQFTVASVRLTAGGILVGLIFGVLVSIWMKRIIRDHTLSIVITIIGSYLSFYLCEFTWLKFGGVAAVVVQGLYLATVVKRKIYSQSEQALDTVWSTMTFCAQTVLFTLIGVISGIQFVKYQTITKEDYIKMFLFWPLMIIVRAITVYGLYPLLKNRGYGLSGKELVVLIYGGLKGGLGLSMAMMITVDPYYPTRFRHLATLYMEGMVLMTVIINGLTCKKVVQWVQMVHIPQIKIKLLKKCINEVLKNTSQKFKQVKIQPQLRFAQWNDVQKLASVNKLGQVETKRQQSAILRASLRDSFKDLKQGDLSEEIRFRFTRYLRKAFWDLYEQGQMSQQAIKNLSQICDIANDNSQQKLSYFQSMEGALSLDTVNLYSKLRDYSIIGPFFSRMLVSKIYFLYEVGTIFVQACQETIRVFKNDFPINNQQLNEVIAQARQNMDLFFAYVGQLQNSFPDVTSAVHTRRASTIVLKNKKNSLKKMFQEGFIDELQYVILRKQIDQSLLKVNYTELKFQHMRVNELLLSYPLFESLSNPQIQSIKNKSSEKIFQKESIILDYEAEFNSVYLILSGSVRQQFENFYLVKSTGSVINPYDFTLKKDSICRVKALNTVKVMEIKMDVIDNLLVKNKQFKERWYKSIFIYESHLNNNLTFLHRTFSQKQFRRFIESSQVKFLRAGEKIYSQFGSFLFEGQVKSEDMVFGQGQGIIPKDRVLQGISECILIKFNQVSGLNVEENLRVSNYRAKSQERQ